MVLGLSFLYVSACSWNEFSCSGHNIRHARESVLRQDLFTLRSVIQQYKEDKHKAPPSLEDLVSAGYFKKVPSDPMTGKPDWTVEQEEVLDSLGQKVGVGDVHSSSKTLACNGSALSSW